MNKLDELLEDVRLTCNTSDVSRIEIKNSLKNLLEWLNKPSNNNNDNCQVIDHFIAFQIISNEKWKSLPDDIQIILFDMGGTLHDTFSNPAIAENFESTPKQLLLRMNRLP